MVESLTPEILNYGYREGIFPMTMEDGSIGWFRPDHRCLFPLGGIHVSRSLARTLRRGHFQVTFDRAFEAVMRGCLRPDDNWISEHFIEVYTECHRRGWGHSCEVWEGEELVGGVYGLAIGGYFAAESMFHRRTDASKVALKHLVDHCAHRGFVLFDAQILNPHLASLGAFTVPHGAFRRLLREAVRVQPESW